MATLLLLTGCSNQETPGQAPTPVRPVTLTWDVYTPTPRLEGIRIYRSLRCDDLSPLPISSVIGEEFVRRDGTLKNEYVDVESPLGVVCYEVDAINLNGIASAHSNRATTQ